MERILIVGPQSENVDKVVLAERAWTDFTSWVAGRLPFVPTEDVQIGVVDQECAGIACAERKDDYALIVLGTKFFSRCVQLQRHTLLHESLHLKLLFHEQFERRVAWVDSLRDRLIAAPPLVGDDLIRHERAMHLWHVPEEALVEHSVTADYPSTARDRGDGFVLDLIANDWRQQIHQLPSALQSFGILFEWLRAELGLGLDLDETSRTACEKLHGEIDTFGSAVGGELWSRQKSVARPVLDVSLSPLRFDEDLSDFLRDQVLQTPLS